MRISDWSSDVCSSDLEFGIIACIAIAILYLAIIVRVLVRLLDEEDSFLILAVTALIAQFGGQAIINMAANTQLFPSKGLTLPFLSYGGSSFIALSLGLGFLLSLTRRNPFAARVSTTRPCNTKRPTRNDPTAPLTAPPRGPPPP